MSEKKRKSKTPHKTPEFIYPAEIAKGLKPGEFRMIGDIYVVPVFVLDPPEPIKKRGNTKSTKKR